MPFSLSEACYYKKENKVLYLQAPKLDLVQSILNGKGFKIVLDGNGKKAYDMLARVHVSMNATRDRFVIDLPSYPSYPRFNTNKVKKWTWKNMTRQLQDGKPTYEVKHVYQLIEAISWLESEGFIVSMSGTVLSYLPPGDENSGKIAVMEKSKELQLHDHQNECVADMEKLHFKGIIADHPGLGKTVSGGEILWMLWKRGLVKRALWVVPTSPLVTQVNDEMKNRYSLAGKTVTGQTVKPKERLGTVKGKIVDETIYEKHGFIVTTWSMYVRDFTGKTFHDITKRVHFDLLIMDEGHRSLYGNKAFEAVLNTSAPYRIMLSGTVMPNGRWEELHDMVSSISPSSVMAKWFFKNIEQKKSDDYAVEGNENAGHDARVDITRMVLAMLMKRVTIHSKEQFAGSIPRLVETTMHVPLHEQEEVIVENMIEMLSETIREWQSAMPLRDGTKRQKEWYYMIESAKNVFWQDLRRFCSQGAFHLERRMHEIMTQPSPMHGWISQNFPGYIDRIKAAFATGMVRMQPKNEKVLTAINQVKPERCLVFYDSVKGCIDLAKCLKHHGKNVKVIVGSDEQFSKEDGELLEQPSKITDAVIEDLIEWFWFPWMTIAKLPDIDENFKVTYISENGNKLDRVYYVTACQLGASFTISIEWNEPIKPDAMKRVSRVVERIAASPAFIVDAEIPGSSRPPGRIFMSIRHVKCKDQRVLVTTDKLNEGANLQIAGMIIFYDHPLSIKQKEQRIARSRRMESMHPVIGIVSIYMGLDYAIGRTLDRKYETASRLGYPDTDPVSMKEVLKMMRNKTFEQPRKDMDLRGFLDGGESEIPEN